MNLLDAKVGEEYIVDSLVTEDSELDAFLFSLGCFAGEPITVISRKRQTMIVAIKDGRYCIDSALGKAINLR